MPTFLIHVQYCYDYLVNQIPMGLLLYSHLPTALLALIFGTYVLVKARNFPAFLFFNLCLIFTLWAAFDLSAWFAFLGSSNVMFTWSLLDLMGALMFFFGYYFLFTFITGKDLPLWQKIAGFLIILPTAVVAFLGINIPTYDLNSCSALEDSMYTHFVYIAEAIFIIASLTLCVLHYRHSKSREEKNRTVFAGIGLMILFLFFFTAGLLVSLFASSDASSYVYNYLIYGLFGMPIFLAYLGYLIVRYHVFNLKMFGAQALVLGLVAALASEYAFVTTVTSRILVGVTLILTIAIGIVLIRSVKREIEQREHIEMLAKNLEQSNKQQVILIHFITHQIKGFLTKSRNIFAAVKEGDLGTVPETMKPFIEEGFSSDTKGVDTIQEILNAANIRNGKVTYNFVDFDFKALLEDIVAQLKPIADQKSLSLNLDAETITYKGDKMQLTNALKNIIDNSVKYTPSGSVNVSLKKEDGKVRFMVQDTGVGITKEDMARLFTEGGHGAESQKINVESTGFGLYIVKNIIEAHHGKVWAESDGAGKGSRFIVELPA